MFGKLKAAAAEAGQGISNAAAAAKEKMESYDKEMREKARVDDEAYFKQLLNVAPPAAHTVMPQGNFSQLLSSYKSAGVPNERMRVVKDACLGGNSFRADQVIAVVKAGDVPLETTGAAVWMYMRVVDQQNWHSVYSAFDVPMSVEIVKERIARAPKYPVVAQPAPQAAIAAPAAGVSLNVNMGMPGVSMSMTQPTASVTVAAPPSPAPTATMVVAPAGDAAERAALIAEIEQLRARIAQVEAENAALRGAAVGGAMIHAATLPGVSVSMSGSGHAPAPAMSSGAMVMAPPAGATVSVGAGSSGAGVMMGGSGATVSVGAGGGDMMMGGGGGGAHVSMGMPGASVTTTSTTSHGMGGSGGVMHSSSSTSTSSGGGMMGGGMMGGGMMSGSFKTSTKTTTSSSSSSSSGMTMSGFMQ